MNELRRTARERLTTLTLLAIMIAAAPAGCGGGAPSRTAARDQATNATCNRFAMCGGIGAGKTYPTMDECVIQWQAEWDRRWPSTTCEGKIDGAQFNVCLSAIMGTACNAADLLATLGKCSAANVCTATGADGG